MAQTIAPTAGSSAPVAARWARVREQVDAHRVTIVATCSMLLVGATVAPILMTPYRSDDARLRRGPAPGVGFWDTVVGSTHEWMTTQGRFFPGAALWSNAVFVLTGDRLAYKVTLAALSAVLVVLAAWFAVTLTRRGWAGPVTVVALASTMTLRSGFFDGLDTYAGLVPWTICLTLATLLLLVRRRGWLSAFVAALLWAVALMTYEVVLALLPAVVLVVWMTTRSRWRALAVVWPTVVDVGVVLWLRAHATGVSINYTTSFEGAAVWRTYLRQVLAAVPLSQSFFLAANRPHLAPQLAVLALLLVGVPALVVLGVVVRARPVATARSLALLGVVGASMWLLTPVFVAVTAHWQKDLHLGDGYITVVWGYLGIALLVVAGWLALVRWWTLQPSRAGALSVGFASVLVAVAVALNIAESYAVTGWLMDVMHASSTLRG